MNVLVWHVHGGWMTSFVQGPHRYLIPVTPDGGGRSGYDWPDSAVDTTAAELRETDIDVVVLQSVDQIGEATHLLGRTPGRDLPAVFLEHNAPQGDVPHTVHPLADRSDLTVVHVSHFNRLFWDSGRAPTVVIEHGILDPGPLYTGDQATVAVVINEPVRRGRVTGTDLLPAFAAVAPIDAFGIDADALTSHWPVDQVPVGRLRYAGDLPPQELHAALALRRVYLHPNRWTSLGLALLEAMHLGMPVLALATTEAIRAVPPEAGAISTDVHDLVSTARLLIADPLEARRRGAVAREVALERYGLEQFLRRWDEVLGDAVATFGRRPG